MIDFRCANCGELLSVPADRAGLEEVCPSCGDASVVPLAAPASPRAVAQPGTITAMLAVGLVTGGVGLIGFLESLGGSGADAAIRPSIAGSLLIVSAVLLSGAEIARRLHELAVLKGGGRP